MQTQLNGDSDASVGANYVAPDGLNQITNHHGNKYENDNDYSQSYDTPRKKMSFFLFW